MDFWKVGVVAGVVLAIGGCSKKTETAVEDKAAAAASVDVPKRKPGLWKQTMLMEGVDVIQAVQLCLDEASDAKLAWWGQQGFRQSCSKNDVQRLPDGSWKFQSVCEGGGTKTTTDGSAVGDFSEKYQLKAETTTSGSPMPAMNGTRTITIDAQWMGACPAGMKPGDMDVGGKRVNMLEMSGQG